MTEHAGRWKFAVFTPSKIWTVGLSAGVSPGGLRMSLAWAAQPGENDARSSAAPGKEK